MPVKSIIPPPKLTHPPGSDTSQPGIFKHGSDIVKVLDLRQKFGVELSEQTQPGNLIIAACGDENFAFWVDQILDVFDFPTTGWGNLPAAIPRGVFSRTLLLNKKIHLYSEFDKLASITDLGYLKHYIQQLQQTAAPDTDSAKTPAASATLPQEPKKTLANTAISKEKTTSVPDQNTPKKTEKETKGFVTQATANTKTSVSTHRPNVEASAYKPSVNTLKTKNVTREPGSISKVKATDKPVINKTTNTANNNKPVTKPLSHTQHAGTVKNSINIDNHIKSKNKQANIANPSTSSTNDDLDEEDTESYLGVIFFFILLFTGIGAGAYYLLSDDKTTETKIAGEERHKEEHYKIEQPILLNEPDYNINGTDSTAPQTADEISTPALSENGVTPKKDITNNISEKSLVIDNESTTNYNYQADITQAEDEITITIHEATSDTPSIKEEPVNTQTVIDNEIQDEKVTDTTPVKPLHESELTPVVPPKKIVNEVIHIVVKGDTLWAIAKKYVNNPFRYPELARLSKIKNPHRIYPGNRVRIRFIKN